MMLPAFADLIERLRNGDEHAFGELVSDLAPRLLRIARQYVKDDATAEEIVQETWIAVLNGLDRFAGKSSLASWISAITVNKSITRGKREARILPFSALARTELEKDEPAVSPDRFAGPGTTWPRHWEHSLTPWAHTPEAELLASETRAMLMSALGALPEAQATIVRLRDVAGYSGPEIAEMLELSEANVRVLLHRGRSKLRSALERHFTRDGTGIVDRSQCTDGAVSAAPGKAAAPLSESAEIVGDAWQRTILIVKTWSKWLRTISKGRFRQANMRA